LFSAETRLEKPSRIFGFQYSGFQAARHNIFEFPQVPVIFKTQFFLLLQHIFLSNAILTGCLEEITIWHCPLAIAFKIVEKHTKSIQKQIA
jgi:hypothetical protein